MLTYEKGILDYLLDPYDRSKSFTGDNRIGQSFSVKLAKLFPKYGDEAEYELFCSVNETVSDLESKGYITSKRKTALLILSRLMCNFLIRYTGIFQRLQKHKPMSSLLVFSTHMQIKMNC